MSQTDSIGSVGSEDQGAAVLVRVTVAELDGAELLHDLKSSTDGALVLFEGRVRDQNLGRQVVGLHYDAYQEMAEQVLAEIGRETASRFDASAVGIGHRVGSLLPGDVSLIVGVLAPHRAQAFDASRYVVEELKRRAPIWKKEEYLDGTSRWLDGQGTGSPPGQAGGVR